MILGIDLGTTNSSCAFYESGESSVIPNDRGNRVTPSIVSFSPSGEILVGEAAKNQAVLNAEGTVRGVKRLMGTGRNIRIGNRSCSPDEISAYILAKLKKDAEAYLGRRVEEAVITVPAYFTENQRRATRRAGALAGLSVRRIINEPTSAGLATAPDLPETCTFLVYDLGGGTFDVSVMKKKGDDLVVCSTAGDNHFGGTDFDEVILEQIRRSFNEQAGMEITSDSAVLQQLTDLAERAKIELSSREDTTVALPFVRAGEKSLHLSYSLTRKKFSDMIQPMIDTSKRLTLRAVADAGLNPSSIEYIVFSGGSSRVPAVRASVLGLFSARVAARAHPEEVVACGAAIQAHMLLHRSGGKTLRDITPLPLGVASEHDGFFSIIGKNTPVPVRKRQVFTTVADGQEAVEIHVLQGLSRRASKNHSLGKFQLFGIQEAGEGVPRIEIVFSIDEDGILNVQARDGTTGAFQDISIAEPGTVGNPEGGKAGDRRLERLIARTEKLYAASRNRLDTQFSAEIHDILVSCKNAAGRGNEQRRGECLVALETIICELESILKEKELKDA